MSDEKTSWRFFDGLLNILSGMGTSRDRATANQQVKTKALNNFDSLEAMYTESSVCRNGVDVIPEQMCRAWATITDKDISPEEIERIQQREQDLKIPCKLLEMLKLNRLYGGAALIPVYAGADLAKPFEKGKNYGQLFNILVTDPRYCTPSGVVEQDALKPEYLLPQFYRLAGSAQLIHRSWMHIMTGLFLPRYEVQRNNYWGQSVLSAAEDDVNRALTTRNGISQLIDELNLDIVSVEGLSGALAAGQKEKIRTRVETYAQTKSLFRILMVDSKEQVSNRQLSASGFPELMEWFYILCASAFHMPVTELLGTSAAGLNATGEGDEKKFKDYLAGLQKSDLAPAVQWCYGLICTELGINPGEKIEFEFPALFQESGLEKEQRLQARSARDKTYYDMGVVSASIIAKELQQDKVYTFMDDKFIAELEKAEKELDQEGQAGINPLTGDPLEGDAGIKTNPPQPKPDGTEAD